MGYPRRKKKMSLYCIMEMLFVTTLSIPLEIGQNQVVYEVKSQDSTYQNEIIYTKAPTHWVKVVNN